MILRKKNSRQKKYREKKLENCSHLFLCQGGSAYLNHPVRAALCPLRPPLGAPPPRPRSLLE